MVAAILLGCEQKKNAAEKPGSKVQEAVKEVITGEIESYKGARDKIEQIQNQAKERLEEKNQ